MILWTFQSCALPGVMYILDGHLCKSQTLVRDAATFELKTGSVKTAFHGVLNVTLHADQKRSTFQKMLCSIWLTSRYCNIDENVALRIPPKLVSKSFFCILSRLNSIDGFLLSLVISFVILLNHFMNLSLFIFQNGKESNTENIGLFQWVTCHLFTILVI